MQKSFFIAPFDKHLYVAKTYLKKFIGKKTIEDWYKYPTVISTVAESEMYYQYKSIPLRTRKKLPSADKIISQETKNASRSVINEILHAAYWYKYTAHKSFYEKYTALTTAQVTHFCKLHSVWEAILTNDNNPHFKNRNVLYDVFNDFFPGKYSGYNPFMNKLSDAKKKGAFSVAFDKRAFGNNVRENKKENPIIDYVVSILVANEQKFTDAVIAEKLNQYCKENNLPKQNYSRRHINNLRREWLKNPEIYESRYGTTLAKKQLPFASMRGANYTNVQWLIDGTPIGYWLEGYKKMNIVFVLDNCSKKILGYAIGESENTEVIKEAIYRAIVNTNGILPNELVSDNHAFTKTQSAFNFENFMLKMGALFTKTSNPQHKSSIERSIQYLNAGFKKYYGYLGSSIKSRSIDAIASVEQTADFAKNFYNTNSVKAIAVSVVESYNETPRQGKTPNERYIEKPHPNPITLNQFQQAELYPNRQEQLIDRGQITLKRGLAKFEYQLPSHLYEQWNNERVLLTYMDLNEGIFIYDISTGEGIAHLKPKEIISAAKAEQTSEDVDKLCRHKGRLKGIKTKARKKLEAVAESVMLVDPEAHLKVNPLITPKDVIHELAQNPHLKMIAEEHGVITSELYSPPKKGKMPIALQPPQKDKNPFTAKGNKIELINPAEQANDESED